MEGDGEAVVILTDVNENEVKISVFSFFFNLLSFSPFSLFQRHTNSSST